MSSNRKDRPPRSTRQVRSVLDNNADFVKLRDALINHKLMPNGTAWVSFTPEDARKFGRKNIARVAKEQIKRLTQPNPEYRVTLYKTNTPVEGSWCLAVEHEPESPDPTKKSLDSIQTAVNSYVTEEAHAVR